MKGLSHIEINVFNLKRSVKFWGMLLKILGYSAYQKWEKGQSWKLKDTYIVFVQADKKYLDIRYHRKRVGLNHLAFHATPAQFRSVKKMLAKKRVPLLYQNQKLAKKLLYFEDPDRIKIELDAS